MIQSEFEPTYGAATTQSALKSKDIKKDNC